MDFGVTAKRTQDGHLVLRQAMITSFQPCRKFRPWQQCHDQEKTSELTNQTASTYSQDMWIHQAAMSTHPPDMWIHQGYNEMKSLLLRDRFVE